MLNDALEVDSIEQVRRHQEALRRAIEKNRITVTGKPWSGMTGFQAGLPAVYLVRT